MDDHSDETESPYSTLSCILLLLATGIVVKTGAALHMCHLGSCYSRGLTVSAGSAAFRRWYCGQLIRRQHRYRVA